MKGTIALRLVKFLNVIVITLLFGACWKLCYDQTLELPLASLMQFLLVLIFLIIYTAFCRIYDALLISYSRISQIIYGQGLSFFMADLIMYFIICLLARRLVTVLPMLALIAVQLLFSAAWATFSHRWYFNHFSGKKSVVVYDVEKEMRSLISEYGFDKKFDVVNILSAQECCADLSVLDEVEVVFLRGVHSKDRNIILKYCVERNISMFLVPRVGDMIMRAAHQMHMFHLPILRVGRYNPPPEYELAKRLLDIILSGLVIVIMSPVMLAVAIAVRTDGGPALYRQVRLTKDGKTFRICKFRSMRVDAEKDGVARLSTGEQDDRITKVGRVIRKFRLDELPQLFNIFAGSMSIVGPRPERPEIAALYEQEIAEFKLRLQVKAGLTGYAQVYGKYNTSPYDKLLLDLMYIAKPSVWEDFKICFATLKILFIPESTEGIREGQTTAQKPGSLPQACPETPSMKSATPDSDRNSPASVVPDSHGKRKDCGQKKSRAV